MTCAIEGCGERAITRLCGAHIEQWLTSGEARRSPTIYRETLGTPEEERRHEVAFGDFIRRVSAENRNSR